MDWNISCSKPFGNFDPCPDGMKEILGMGCEKKSYSRAVNSSKARCPEGKVLDKGLGMCYDPCPDNASAKAGLCVGTCPTGLTFCGAGLCLPKG